MRFAALQGSGTNDYINAGKAAADSAVKGFAINRKTGPDYGELAKAGMAARSAERQMAMKTGAHVTKAGIKAVANVNEVAIREGAKAKIREINKPSKMAGAVAAIGNIAAAGFLMKDDDKRTPPSNLDAKKDLIKQWQANRDAKTAERDASRTDYVPPSELETPATPSNTNASATTDDSPTSTVSNPSTQTTQGNVGKVVSPVSSKSTEYDGTFGSVYNMAKKSGAKYPELVAAQWQLESASGTAISGKNNFFGIKASANESGTSKGTWEEANGQAYNTSARFKNFGSPQDSVNELVSRWHQDYKGYSGVNNSASAADAAHSLKAQGYATDSKYATKLIDIMRRNGY